MLTNHSAYPEGFEMLERRPKLCTTRAPPCQDDCSNLSYRLLLISNETVRFRTDATPITSNCIRKRFVFENRAQAAGGGPSCRRYVIIWPQTLTCLFVFFFCFLIAGMVNINIDRWSISDWHYIRCHDRKKKKKEKP